MATITSATSGPSNATSTWSGGVVPVSGDKVIIAHPGTNTLAATTLYTTTTALSVGATSIPVSGSTGSIVAGECIQLEVEIPEFAGDGLPVYHNAYYKVVTGISANGTIVIEAPGLLIDVPAGTQVVNAGHVVTLEASHTWGDDTSNNTTDSSNAIVVRGTLRASRTTSLTLTCRGSLYTSSSSIIDFGFYFDAIPPAVKLTIITNESATRALGKHIFGVGSSTPTASRIKMCGAFRNRNIYVGDSLAAGATSFVSSEATGWEVGDRIIFASANDEPNGAQIVTVTGHDTSNGIVSFTPVLAVARSNGTWIGNLSSNILFKPAASNLGGPVAFGGGNARSFARISNVAFQDVGHGSGWTPGSQPDNMASLGFSYTLGDASAYMCAVDRTFTTSTASAFAANRRTLNRPMFLHCAVTSGASASAIYCGQLSRPYIENVVAYVCNTYVMGTYGGGCELASVVNGAAWCWGGVVNANELPGFEFSNFAARNSSTSQLFLSQGGKITYTGGTLSGGNKMFTLNNGATGRVEISGTTFSGGGLNGSNATANLVTPDAMAILSAINNDEDDNRVITPYFTAYSDTSMRKSTRRAVRIEANTVGRRNLYRMKFPVQAGKQESFFIHVRRDTAFGSPTGYPDAVYVSFRGSGFGSGVVFLLPGENTADTWYSGFFDIFPTATEFATLDIYFTMKGAGGKLWIDGIPHSPMTPTEVRNFGSTNIDGFWSTDFALSTTDPAVAAAYPVVVNHNFPVVLVNGNLTAQEVATAIWYSFCLPENLGRPLNGFSYDGYTFKCPYLVNVAPLYVIPQPYQAGGSKFIPVTVTGVAAGVRVQLYHLTQDYELFNGVSTGDNIVVSLYYPDLEQSIRLRIDSTAIEAQEVITLAGAGGLTFAPVLVADPVYAANGIDGSTCTEFSTDGANIQIDIDDPDGVTSVQRLYAWMQWYQTTAAGIASQFFGAITALDTANYLIDQTKADIKLDNRSANPLRIVGGMLSRKDGSTVIATGSNSIQMDPGRAYVASGGSSGGGLSAADVWAHPSRTLTEYSLPAGDRVIVMRPDGTMLAR